MGQAGHVARDDCQTTSCTGLALPLFIRTCRTAQLNVAASVQIHHLSPQLPPFPGRGSQRTSHNSSTKSDDQGAMVSCVRCVTLNTAADLAYSSTKSDDKCHT